MAGSRQIFAYTSDNGNRYLLEADESNTESVNAGLTVSVMYPVTAELRAGSYVPKTMRPRKVIYRSEDGACTIIAVVLTLNQVSNIPPRITVSTADGNIQVVRSFYHGESFDGPFD